MQSVNLGRKELDFQCIFIQYERLSTGSRWPLVCMGFYAGRDGPSTAVAFHVKPMPLLRLHASAFRNSVSSHSSTDKAPA